MGCDREPAGGVAAEAWTPYKGSRGGQGWQDTATGEVRYQEQSPERDPAGKTATAANSQAPAANTQPETPQASQQWYGGWQPRFQKPDANAFIASRNKTTRPQYLSPLAAGDLDGKQVFLSADGKVGAAVAQDGDIQNVFNNGGPKGAGAEAIIEALKRGGHTLDCYAGHLPLFYAQCGFVETGRMKFNRDYAPPNWDYAHDDDPDVVFMALGEHKDDEAIRTDATRTRDQWEPPAKSTRYYADWDQAKADARGASRGRRGGEIRGAGVGGQPRGPDPQSGAGDRQPVAPEPAAVPDSALPAEELQQARQSAGELYRRAREQGGFTYQPVLESSPQRGYAVSPFRDAERVFSFDKLTEDDLYNYIVEMWDRFDDTRIHLGSWHDTGKGNFYLDLSVVVDSPEEAQRLSQEHNQEGYYDLERGETVIVKSAEQRRGSVESHHGPSPAAAGRNQGNGRAPPGQGVVREAEAGQRDPAADPTDTAGVVAEAAWDPNEHPRGDGGKFSDDNDGGYALSPDNPAAADWQMAIRWEKQNGNLAKPGSVSLSKENPWQDPEDWSTAVSWEARFGGLQQPAHPQDDVHDKVKAAHRSVSSLKYKLSTTDGWKDYFRDLQTSFDKQFGKGVVPATVIQKAIQAEDALTFKGERFGMKNGMDIEDYLTAVIADKLGVSRPRSTGKPKGRLRLPKEFTAESYNEADHPRGEAGRWTTKGHAQLTSPEFKEWFGDWQGDQANSSRVVDKDGAPLRLYHGTSADFDTFGSRQDALSAIGWHYFSDNPDFAAKFAGSDEPLDFSTAPEVKPPSRPDPDQTVEIQIRNEAGEFIPTPVDAWSTKTPGLVVAGSVGSQDGKFMTITHQPSGLALSGPISYKQAQLLGAKLSSLGVDWTQDQAGLMQAVQGNVMQQVKELVKTASLKSVREWELDERPSGNQIDPVTLQWKADTIGVGSAVLPVYLNLRNPLDLTELKARKPSLKQFVALLNEKGIGMTILDFPFSGRDLYQMLNDPDVAENIRTKASRAGYDGIVFKDFYDPKTRGTSYIAFHPDQIKSSSGNRGTFRGERINESVAQEGWVTLNAGSGEDGKGGVRVLIGDDGEVKKGPSGIKGKSMPAAGKQSKPLDNLRSNPDESGRDEATPKSGRKFVSIAEQDRNTARARLPNQLGEINKSLIAARQLELPGSTKKDAVKAVRLYTSHAFAEMNAKMRGGDAPEKVSPEAAKIQSLASQKLPQTVIVYRGVSRKAANAILEGVNSKKRVSTKGFVSTSVSPAIATMFTARKGGVLLEIQAKRGLYVQDISKHKGEFELIQPHGTKYKYAGTHSKVLVSGIKVDVIMLEEI